MKKLITLSTNILLFTLFLFSNQLIAQEILQPTDEKTYTEYMDKVLESLNLNDATEFKNSILYDRVYPFAGLDLFNETD